MTKTVTPGPMSGLFFILGVGGVVAGIFGHTIPGLDELMLRSRLMMPVLIVSGLIGLGFGFRERFYPARKPAPFSSGPRY